MQNKLGMLDAISDRLPQLQRGSSRPFVDRDLSGSRAAMTADRGSRNGTRSCSEILRANRFCQPTVHRSGHGAKARASAAHDLRRTIGVLTSDQAPCREPLSIGLGSSPTTALPLCGDNRFTFMVYRPTGGSITLRRTPMRGEGTRLRQFESGRRG